MVDWVHEVLATVDMISPTSPYARSPLPPGMATSASPPSTNAALYRLGHLADRRVVLRHHILDLPPRVWPPVHPRGGPASNRQVAVVGDPNSVRAECFQQPSFPKRCGALLDPRPMGGNA